MADPDLYAAEGGGAGLKRLRAAPWLYLQAAILDLWSLVYFGDTPDQDSLSHSSRDIGKYTLSLSL